MSHGERRPTRLAFCLAVALTAGVVVLFPAIPAGAAQGGPNGPLLADPRQRLAAEQEYLGTADSRAAHAAVTLGSAERKKQATSPQTALTPTPTWMNVGPANARFEWNGQSYVGVDSGRVNTVRVASGNPDAVYVGTAGGGIWKTANFSAAAPTWTPIGDGLPALAIGAFDISSTDPNTIVAGLGDPFDTISVGGATVRTTNGGATWGAPFLLPLARNIRDLRIDPSNANIVLAAADSGLFRSIDGGVTFAAVFLGNLTPAPGAWNIAYLGSSAGQSRWVVSAMAGNGTSGLGDLYLSTDSGATFGSLRLSGGLPTTVTPGRMAVGAGTAANPALNTVYVAAGNTSGSTFQAMLKSTNGGATFNQIATASTIPTNPTVGSDCRNFNVGQNQVWYDITIAVDPTNSSNVVTGGSLCGYRTTDGGVTWSVASHWLPPYGKTASGTPGYAHADWHSSVVVPITGGVRTIIGDDGGIGSADDLFSTPVPEHISWRTPNQGLSTFQFYGVGSGDPAHHDASLVQAGAQDNGTRLREIAYGQPAGTFNQVIGGDGIETTIGRTAGGATVYWASVEYGRYYCVPAARSCDQPNSYSGVPGLANEPFLIRYSPVQGNSNGAVLTINSWDVFRMVSTNPGGAPVQLSSGFFGGGAQRAVRDVDASPFVYSSPSLGTRLYGVALNGGFAAIGTDTGGPISWTLSTNPVGTGALTSQRELNTSSVAIPRSAPHLGGTVDGQTYLLSTTAPVMADGVTPVPDAIGRLFITKDGGSTWQAFHGNGTSDLPNLPIFVVRFDPSDTTDHTIYVANELGVYRTADGGQTWSRFGAGLPNVAVRDMYVSPDGSYLRIATFGRGVWELAAHAPATNTELTTSVNASGAGQPLTLVATVSPVMPTGTVNFFDGATQIGSSALSGYPAQASFVTAALTLGTHNLTASYAGDGFYQASTSSVFAQQVRRPTSTVATCGTKPDPVGAAIACSATVTDIGTGTPVQPTGTVSWTVSAGKGTLSAAGCTLSLGKCSVKYTPAGGSMGAHTLTALYAPGTIDTAHASSSGVANLTVVKPTAIAVGDSGTILVTTDGGATWHAKTSGVIANLRAVSQPSNTVAFAVGDAGTILVSKNNGGTWAVQPSGTTQALFGVSFFTPTKGIAVGAAGTVLLTSNGGTTWTPGTSPTTADVTSVSFISSTTAYAVGKGGLVMKSTNGGSTWSIQSSGTTQDLTGVSFATVKNGFAVGKAGTILMTNTGNTWSVQTSGTAQDLNAVSTLSPTAAIAAGSSGTTLVTNNGGSSWPAATSGTSQNLNAALDVDLIDALAAGNAGTALVSTTGATSWSTSSTGSSATIRGIAGR
jgi:photosystem II stability/assembly factor-like uncharacterized protein